MIHLTLPLPPSINAAYAWKEIRYKSATYKQWEDKVDIELRKQEAYTITGDEWLSAHYILHIDLYYKNGEKRIIDCSNYEKAISDFLGWYVDPITRKPMSRRYKHLGVQRIPGFHDHKIIVNTQSKKQKMEWVDDWIEIVIEEVII